MLLFGLVDLTLRKGVIIGDRRPTNSMHTGLGGLWEGYLQSAISSPGQLRLDSVDTNTRFAYLARAVAHARLPNSVISSHQCQRFARQMF